MERDRELAQFLILMAENFGEDLSEARLEMLMNALEPFLLEDIRSGLEKLMRTRKFRGFPNLAEILEAVGGGEDEAIMSQAEKEWLKLLNLPTGTGADREFVGIDPETGDLIFRQRFEYPDSIARQVFESLGGSKAKWTSQNTSYLQRQFIEQYVQIAAREARTSQRLPVSNRPLLGK